jgi:Ca-activated chloride channel family protein
MPRRNRTSRWVSLQLGVILSALVLFPAALAAQGTPSTTGPARSASDANKSNQYQFNVNVNMVVLHATVLDHKGHMVNHLTKNNFRVYEDGVLQHVAVFSHADIPVTMGIVIDDSGSMRDKRPSVDAAAYTFVKTSNPFDQVFVVNFNDEYYLDTPGNFASNAQELKAALDKIDSRGGTALYDAVYASLDHLKLGSHNKKVLLVITDGEDNASRYTFDELIQHAEQSNAVIYCIGLLGQERSGGLFKLHGGEDKRAAKVLKELAKATGGQAYFPKSLDEVESTCVKIARDIRNQYTLAYYPTNTKRDGTYRRIRIELVGPGTKHYIVRTRPGYYAPKGNQPATMAGGA